MEQDEPRWGEPPSEEMIAELLEERFPIEKGERLSVSIDPEEHDVTLTMIAGRHRYVFRVAYLRAAGSRDPWFLMIDALDNMFGTFIESNRAYRELPSGTDVEFDGAFFRVTVEHTMPEMERIADQILKRNGHAEEE